MKKVVLVVLLVALILAPVMAANNPMQKYSGATKKDSLGIGLNLGTNTGVGISYGMGKYDVIADIGLNNFGVYPLSLRADCCFVYTLYDVVLSDDLGISKATLPVTVGLAGAAGLTFADDFQFGVSVLVPVGIQYTFDNFPCTLYLRIAPGLSLVDQSGFAIGFGFAGYIGALYLL